MRFARKIFIAVFLTTVALGTALIWLGHNYVTKQTKEDFIARYSTLSKVMGDTLTRLDTSAEAHMLNAAKVVAERDKQQGLLSTTTLKSMKEELNVTHIFVVDKNGQFIRSTNEDPTLIPNAFSFCEGYRKMVVGTSNMEATPIIEPKPEPKPYKFLFIPNHNRERLLEVGLRVDFVAKSLKETLGADSNIASMSLYSPDGNALARFTSKDFQFKKGKESLPTEFPAVIESDDLLHVFTKVTSSHPVCCQCNVSGTSKNGEYYYILESEVSKKELAAVLASTKDVFILLALANFALAYILSRVLAQRLVRNIKQAVERVRKIKNSGSLDERIELNGRDEVAFLTNEFDRMLDSLQASQKRVVEAEKVQAKVQLAKEVAHNIRSPIIAVEMMLPTLVKMPERIQKVLRDSVGEIKALAERLSKQVDSFKDREVNSNLENVFLPSLLEDVVTEKRVEYSQSPKIDISFRFPDDSAGLDVSADRSEMKSVFSNLVNNAVQSYPDNIGPVEISCKQVGSTCVVEVKDSGRGISKEVLGKLGIKEFTFGKEEGRGVGLAHTYRVVQSWGGKVEIESKEGIGTKILVALPKILESSASTEKNSTRALNIQQH